MNSFFIKFVYVKVGKKLSQRLILEKYSIILAELKNVVQNDEFPINKYAEQKLPDEFNVKWKSAPKKILNLVPNFKPSVSELTRNLTCKKCMDRISAIRGFIHQGSIPILVLHYTGEISPNKKVFSKTGKNQVFREQNQEDLFDRMVQKVFSVRMRELNYQEFPGCNFKNVNSSSDEWKQRSKNCLEHVALTVKSNNIKGIIITGRAAVSYYGIEKAENLLEKIHPFEFEDFEIPSIVIRSPEKVLSLEDKKKKLEHLKESSEYKNAVEEEKNIKLQIVRTLTDFKNRILS